MKSPDAGCDQVSATPVDDDAKAPSVPKHVLRNLQTNTIVSLRALLRPARFPDPAHSSGTVALVLALIGAAAISMLALDAKAVEWARAEPQWFRAAFEEITQFGLSGWFLFPCGFILLVLGALTSPRLPTATQAVLAALGARVGFVFLAIAAPGLFVSIVKRLIGRARPFVGGHEDPFAYVPFAWNPAYASMPSGHSTTAVAAAIAIGAIWPRTRAVMWLYAAAIMLSRVAVVAHHPSDVIGGAVVALVGTRLVQRAFAARGLVFRADDLRAKPAPSRSRITTALRQAIALRNFAA